MGAVVSDRTLRTKAGPPHFPSMLLISPVVLFPPTASLDQPSTVPALVILHQATRADWLSMSCATPGRA